MKALKYLSIGLLLTVGFNSCSTDFLDAEDTSVLTPDQAGEAAAKNPEAFLNGMWSYMVEYNHAGNESHDDFGFMSTLFCFEVMSEDIAFDASHWFIYDYDFDYRLEQWQRPYQHWELFYTNIAKANEIIGFFPDGPETVAEKGLAGQAYAMRGMSYYYLIQMFQDFMKKDNSGEIDRDAPGVPIIYLESDGKTQDEITEATGRNTVGEVLDAAQSDLEKAVELLEAGYIRPSGDSGKNYIDASVANGLLARVYLLTGQWQKAANAANKARKNYGLRTFEELHDGFMNVGTSDVMWGFNHTTETQTSYASFFSHLSSFAPGYAGIGYCTKLIDARLYSQIADDDYRKDLFNGPDGDSSQPTTGSKKPYANLKFGDDGNWTMDYIYMRAPEMVLIEAEAYAHLGDGAKAASVLKELMAERQPSWNKATVTVKDVELQRRIELWGEGFRFFDLKRMNEGIDRNYEGSNHLAGHLLTVPAHDVLWTYQIPRREIQNNEHISQDEQNP